MEPKRYQFNGKWQTKEEIKEQILYRNLQPKGKFGNVLFYGFCNTEFENAIVEENYKISITVTFTNNQGKHFKLRGKIYYFDKMEKIQERK